MSAKLDPLSQLVEAAVIRALDSAGARTLPRCMSREQAAEHLAVEPEAIDRLFHQGKLKRVRVSERIFRYDRAELERFVEENQCP